MSKRLPTGWSVELQGLTNAVKFTHTDGYGLFWCDGVWSMLTSTGRAMRAVSVPHAHDQKSARTVGTAWIAANF